MKRKVNVFMGRRKIYPMEKRGIIQIKNYDGFKP